MCCELGSPSSTKNQYPELMKQQYELFIAGAWGLHFSSYLMQSMPFLQFLSLILAITASTLTIIKSNKRK